MFKFHILNNFSADSFLDIFLDSFSVDFSNSPPYLHTILLFAFKNEAFVKTISKIVPNCNDLLKSAGSTAIQVSR